MDCGPACLKMVARHHGVNISQKNIRELCYINKHGVSLLGIADAAEKLGFKTIAARLSVSDTNTSTIFEAPLPAILHWEGNHFVVLRKISKKRALIMDPAIGKRNVPIREFTDSWVVGDNKGIALILDPSLQGVSEYDEEHNKAISFFGIIRYLKLYRKLIAQFVLGLILLLVFQVVAPFLAQSIVDVGIQNQNIGFIYVVLLAQLFLVFGQASVQLVQNWILLHIGTRLNISLVSSFLIRMMKMPLNYFESRNNGDILQRIGDHSRIEEFITRHLLNAMMGAISLVVFSAILILYKPVICFVFLGASLVYVMWIVIFLPKRKRVDNRLFAEMAANQESILEIVNGIYDIKIHGSETKRRQNWLSIQSKLFNANIEALKVVQYQDIGAISINQIKDITIVVLAASAVINNEITLGMMIAIQYIIGQMNAPLQSFVSFIRTGQDANISLSRLNEVYSEQWKQDSNGKNTIKPPLVNKEIAFDNVSFAYSPIDDFVLENVSFTIQSGLTTAIVGASGSGKSTIIKLLLGLANPTEGKVTVGNINLKNIDNDHWKNQCGVVSQHSYLFSDTIISNVSESDFEPNLLRLEEALKTACIDDFINQLPLGYNTKIGKDGYGLSQGQRQRILIARAVYSNPDLLVFDEATSFLDSTTESEITKRLGEFTRNRTCVIIAHRLSTVKNADQIIVLEKGKIVEVGTHHELIDRKGEYHKLVFNQLS